MLWLVLMLLMQFACFCLKVAVALLPHEFHHLRDDGHELLQLNRASVLLDLPPRWSD